MSINPHIPTLRVLYIPQPLNVVKDDIRLASDMSYLSSIFSKEDCLFLYVENERFLRGDVEKVFGDFKPFFENDEWVAEHSEDIAKELDHLNLKRKNKVILRDDWKHLDIRFNGRTLFLIEDKEQEIDHGSISGFYDAVLTKLADGHSLSTLKQLKVYEAFCHVDEPDTFNDPKETQY